MTLLVERRHVSVINLDLPSFGFLKGKEFDIILCFGGPGEGSASRILMDSCDMLYIEGKAGHFFGIEIKNRNINKR